MSSPPAWSMGRGKRSSLTNFAASPGPGAYDSAAGSKKAPTWKMGTSIRNTFSTNETPGPGTYQTPLKARRAPSYVFGLKTALHEKDIVPGPGAYDFRRASESKKGGFTFQSKSFAQDYRTESPGPGAYDQSSTITNSRPGTCKIGTAKRSELANCRESPGPGAYIVDVNTSMDGPRHGFGTSTRKELDTITRSNPGPGTYTLSHLFQRSNSKGPSLVGKRPDTASRETGNLPGPGAYTPSLLLKTKAPAYRIGSASRSFITGDVVTNPGPGNYDTNASFNKGKAVRIGSALRKPINERSITPGPGSYNHSPTRTDGPSHVIIPRRPDSSFSKCRENPGPGAYSPTINLVKKSDAKIRIGTSVRDELAKLDDSPGPGAYNNSRSAGEGPQWRFPSAQRSRINGNKSTTEPGPGAYTVPTKFADIPSYARSGFPAKMTL